MIYHHLHFSFYVISTEKTLKILKLKWYNLKTLLCVKKLILWYLPHTALRQLPLYKDKSITSIQSLQLYHICNIKKWTSVTLLFWQLNWDSIKSRWFSSIHFLNRRLDFFIWWRFHFSFATSYWASLLMICIDK